MESRSHDGIPAEITEHLARIVATHYRQTADVVADHLLDGLVENFVRIRDDEISAAGVDYGQAISLEFFNRPQHVAAGNDPAKRTTLIKNQRPLTARQFAIAFRQPVRKLRH